MLCEKCGFMSSRFNLDTPNTTTNECKVCTALEHTFSKKSLLDLIPYDNLTHLDNRLDNDKDFLLAIHLRHSFINRFGIYGLPCKESLEWLANHAKERTVYDFGAGVGYLSYGIKKVNPNLNVIALDNFTTSYRPMYERDGANIYKLSDKKAFYPVTTHNAVRKANYINNSLVIMCWPDFKSDFAFKIASRLNTSNELIYIGEERGCTANDKFFDNFALEPINDMPWFTWAALHDYVFRVKLKR